MFKLNAESVAVNLATWNDIHHTDVIQIGGDMIRPNPQSGLFRYSNATIRTGQATFLVVQGNLHTLKINSYPHGSVDYEHISTEQHLTTSYHLVNSTISFSEATFWNIEGNVYNILLTEDYLDSQDRLLQSIYNLPSSIKSLWSRPSKGKPVSPPPDSDVIFHLGVNVTCNMMTMNDHKVGDVYNFVVAPRPQWLPTPRSPPASHTSGRLSDTPLHFSPGHLLPTSSDLSFSFTVMGTGNIPDSSSRPKITGENQHIIPIKGNKLGSARDFTDDASNSRDAHIYNVTFVLNSGDINLGDAFHGPINGGNVGGRRNKNNNRSDLEMMATMSERRKMLR